MTKLSDNLEIEVSVGDLLLYRTNRNSITIFEVEESDTDIDLFDCVEILCFSSRRHFVSNSPYQWEEVRF